MDLISSVSTNTSITTGGTTSLGGSLDEVYQLTASGAAHYVMMDALTADTPTISEAPPFILSLSTANSTNQVCSVTFADGQSFDIGSMSGFSESDEYTNYTPSRNWVNSQSAFLQYINQLEHVSSAADQSPDQANYQFDTSNQINESDAVFALKNAFATIENFEASPAFANMQTSDSLVDMHIIMAQTNTFATNAPGVLNNSLSVADTITDPTDGNTIMSVKADATRTFNTSSAGKEGNPVQLDSVMNTITSASTSTQTQNAQVPNAQFLLLTSVQASMNSGVEMPIATAASAHQLASTSPASPSIDMDTLSSSAQAMFLQLLDTIKSGSIYAHQPNENSVGMLMQYIDSIETPKSA